MLVALIELNDSCHPFCEFGGVVETPKGITHEDMPDLYRQWVEKESKDAFAEWLVRNHGCTEIKCGFAMLDRADADLDSEDEAED